MSDEAKLTPDPQNSPSASLGARDRKYELECEKLEAERDKAREELRRLQAPRWRFASYCSGVLPIVAGAAAVSVASIGMIISWKLGTFTVAKDKAEIAITRLESLRRDVSSVSNEIEGLKFERDLTKTERNLLRGNLDFAVNANRILVQVLASNGVSIPSPPSPILNLAIRDDQGNVLASATNGVLMFRSETNFPKSPSNADKR